MIRLLLTFTFGLASAFALSLRAQSPTSIGDLVYRDSATAGAIAPEIFSTSVILRADGTYTLFSGKHRGLITPGFGPFYLVPVEGTYHYTKTGPNTATLVLDQGNGISAIADARGGVTVALTFNDPSSGSGTFPIVPPNSLSSSLFTLSPISNLGVLPLINISTRVVAGPSAPAIVGFVMNGTRDILIRVVGPGLAQFGLKSFWATPKLALYHVVNGVNVPVALPPGAQGGASTSWSDLADKAAAQQKAWSMTGAFPLVAGSADLSEVLTLPAGAYVITAQPAAGEGGDVLVETYLLP